MPVPLDWLGVQPQVNQAPASWFAPAVPVRSYGLSPADAVMQMRQALPAMQAAAQTADLARQQSLAPLQQQINSLQMQDEFNLRPKAIAGRESFIKAVSGLDPASDNYLEERRNIIMQNPYAVADPLVQQVLRANDTAYDDYLSTKRWQAYNYMHSPEAKKNLSPSQKLAAQKRLTILQSQLDKALTLSDSPKVIQGILDEMHMIHGMLGEQEPSGSAVDSAVDVDVPPELPSSAATNELPRMQRWQSAKEYMLEALNRMAAAKKISPYQLSRRVMHDSSVKKEFFQDYVGAQPHHKAFDDPNRWGFDDISWQDVFTALQDDKPMLPLEDDMPLGSTPGKFRIKPAVK